jgi:general secretion pathway protein J
MAASPPPMTDRLGQDPESGFTLLEIIVAVVVFGFVIAGLSQATRFGIHAWSVETKLTDTAAEMERVERVLRIVIEQASPPLAADDKSFSGLEHRAVFTTRLPDEPQTRPIRRAQIAIGVDDNHRLLIRWQPHPNAVPIGTKPPPQEVVLAEHVDHVDFSYRQAAGDGGKWVPTWTLANLPAIVLIHIELQNDHRKWPAIMIPTMLDTNGSF